MSDTTPNRRTEGGGPEARNPQARAVQGGPPRDGGAVAAGPMDTAWLVAAVLLLLGGIVAYHVFAAQPLAARIAMVVVGLVAGVGAFWMSAHGKAVWTFATGSRVELRKMVWPTGTETRNVTLIVFVFVLLLGIFFWVIDWVLAWGTRTLLGGGA